MATVMSPGDGAGRFALAGRGQEAGRDLVQPTTTETGLPNEPFEHGYDERREANYLRRAEPLQAATSRSRAPNAGSVTSAAAGSRGDF